MSTTFLPRPFTLNTPQSELDDLKLRLSKTRYAKEIIPYTAADPEPDAVAFGFGAHGPELSWIQGLANDWGKYDWAKREEELNA